MDDLIRRVDLTVVFMGKDISDLINGYINSIKVIDNYSGMIDSLEIKMSNKNEIALKEGWSFSISDQLRIGARTLNWERTEGVKDYLFGLFNIDEKYFDKQTATYKGLSVPLKSKNTKNSKTWTSISLKSLAQEFADKYSLELNFLSGENPILKELSQERETDLSFLKKTCEEENIRIKVCTGSLTLFEDEKMELRDPGIKLSLNKTKSYFYKETSNDIYDAVEVKYFDIKTDKYIDRIVTIEELNGNSSSRIPDKILKINKNYKNIDEDFRKFALKKLKSINDRAKTLEIQVIGRAGVYAGQVLEVTNSGTLNGKYLITKVTQTLPGFLTKIESFKINREE